jgi:hypothetical protein
VSGRIVFLDTETTGLSLTDDVWDFAAIVREPGESDREVQTFIRHDEGKAEQLPEAFLADYRARYDHDLALTGFQAARLIADLTSNKAHVVGAVPNFDTERLALLLRRYGIEPRWHYHLIDVENLAVGYLAGKGALIAPPWDSDELSARLGIVVPKEERHTALGDARWARDLYDAVMSVGAS